MGFGYTQDDFPRMCFNGPRSWKLGWYSDRHATFTYNNGATSTINLIGASNYLSASGNDVVIIKLDASVTDYYIAFNRQSGANSETQEGGDQVMITHKDNDDDYDPSILVAKLNALETYTIDDFDGKGDVQVKVDVINTSGDGFAQITITNATSTESSPPTPLPTSPPTKVRGTNLVCSISPCLKTYSCYQTPPPTPKPTLPPIPKPTPLPSPPPTPISPSTPTTPPPSHKGSSTKSSKGSSKKISDSSKSSTSPHTIDTTTSSSSSKSSTSPLTIDTTSSNSSKSSKSTEGSNTSSKSSKSSSRDKKRKNSRGKNKKRKNNRGKKMKRKKSQGKKKKKKQKPWT